MESTVNNKEEITGVLSSYSDGGAGVEDALAANELLYPVDSIVCIIFLPKVLRQFETWSTKRIGRTSRRIADHGGAQYLRERERETARRQEEVDPRREETSRRWDTMAKKNCRRNGADLGLDIALLCGIFAEDESGRPRELNGWLD